MGEGHSRIELQSCGKSGNMYGMRRMQKPNAMHDVRTQPLRMWVLYRQTPPGCFWNTHISDGQKDRPESQMTKKEAGASAPA